MKIAEQEFDELPNLSFVRNLSNMDSDFQNRFIITLKEEFANNYFAYKYHSEMEEPRAAAEIVHRLKYVFSFLAMHDSFQLAERHQEKLQMGDTSLQSQFGRILQMVKQFLSKY